MSYETTCPSCGTAVVFAFDQSIILVCDSCKSLLVRHGADIENTGEVAELASTPSLLSLGDVGRYADSSFRIVGRVQVAYEQGVWDEWRVAFDDGRFGWLAESLGRRHILLESAQTSLPAWGEIVPGMQLEVPQPVIVTEIGEARVAAISGELPRDTRPDDTWRYVELSGTRGQFGTIQFGATSSVAEALFVGRSVTLEDIGLGHVSREARKAPAHASALQCPHCAGALTLRLPDETKRIACRYCGTLIAVDGSLRAIETPKKNSVKRFHLRFHLGSQANLDGAMWTLVGAMQRSAGGYAWQEYLLHEPSRGFRWLVTDKNHWCILDGINPGDASFGGSTASWQGTTFKHFLSNAVRVDALRGEFPWHVRRGEKVLASDYVAPPLMLSHEKSQHEFTVSAGRYVTPDAVAQAFGVPPASLALPSGVHPAQPNPVVGIVTLWLTAALAGVLTLAVYIFLSLTGGKTVYSQTVTIASTAVSGAPEAAFIGDKFVVPRSGNLEILTTAPVSNSWLYVDGTIANAASDVVRDFESEVGYYSGVEGGETWNEGSVSTRTFVGRVPAGEYTLRIDPQWGSTGGTVPRSYEIKIRSRVPRLYQLMLALVAIFAWPLVATARHSSFESARWAESDHAGSTDDNDEEGE